MTKREEEFKFISEDDYKTLISVYQQKTFKLFNENISLEAKVATLNSLVDNLNNTITSLTELLGQEKEKNSKKTARKAKSSPQTDVLESKDSEEFSDEETFN